MDLYFNKYSGLFQLLFLFFFESESYWADESRILFPSLVPFLGVLYRCEFSRKWKIVHYLETAWWLGHSIFLNIHDLTVF